MREANTSFERRLKILFLLNKCRKTTARELSQLYSVTPRTIRNDIVFLSRFVPLYTDKGYNGGIKLIDSYKADLFLYLTDEESRLLEKITENLCSEDKLVMSGIINKYSMPQLQK